MSFGYLPVKNQLVSILQGVSSLKVVYGKEAKALGQFPAACVSAMGHENSFHDLAANDKTYHHFVRIYFRTDENNDADYEDVLESVADDVITALEHNLTLNGSCDWSLPTSGNWGFGEKEVPVRYLELVVTSRARVIR